MRAIPDARAQHQHHGMKAKCDWGDRHLKRLAEDWGWWQGLVCGFGPSYTGLQFSQMVAQLTDGQLSEDEENNLVKARRRYLRKGKRDSI